MKVDTRKIGEVTLVKPLCNRLDAAAVVQFKDAMRAALADCTGRIILDMGQVSFLDSSGLGAIVGIRKHAAYGQRLELANLSPAVQKVFTLTRMSAIFAIHDSVDGALVAADPAVGPVAQAG